MVSLSCIDPSTTFVITGAILLTAIVSAALYTVKAANAQGNMSIAGGANMTKDNMTKGNMTGAAMAFDINKPRPVP